MVYRVQDNITCETLEFDDRMDAEMVALRRLEKHRSGYDLRHTHIPPIKNAVLKVYKEDYIICKE